MSGRELQPGQVVKFLYPRHNFHGVLSRMETRHVQIEEVRDLKEEPLERVTFDIQPLLKRGRYLITGQDLERGQTRSFYTSSMKSVETVG